MTLFGDVSPHNVGLKVFVNQKSTICSRNYTLLKVCGGMGLGDVQLLNSFSEQDLKDVQCIEFRGVGSGHWRCRQRSEAPASLSCQPQASLLSPRAPQKAEHEYLTVMS